MLGEDSTSCMKLVVEIVGAPCCLVNADLEGLL